MLLDARQNCRAVRIECREILFAKLLIDECHVCGEHDEISREISIGRGAGGYLHNHLSLASSSIMRHSNFIIASPGILTTACESRVCSREHVESNVLRSTSATSDLIITLSIKCRRDTSKDSLLPIHFPRKFEERLENSALEDIAGPCSSMSHSAFLEEGFLALRYCPQTRQSPICST